MSEIGQTSDMEEPKKQGRVQSRATSDMEEPKMQGRVRSRANFGHGRAKKAGSCPSRVGFGHGRAKKAGSCLKSGKLRTWKSQKCKVVSEVGQTSDMEEPKMQGRVRSRANFGHGRAKNAGSCPKSGKLRTWKGKKAGSCLKSGKLRTWKSQKCKVVSEVVSASDMEGPKKQGRVRSRANFGQGRAKKARSCPNQ